MKFVIELPESCELKTGTVLHTFGYPEAILTVVVLLALMIALAFAWEKVKSGPAGRRRLVQAAMFACFALVFFFGPN